MRRAFCDATNARLARFLIKLRHYQKSLTLLPDTPEIYAALKDVVGKNRVQRVKVYDARLVATMNVFDIGAILTFNTVDFERYSYIKAIPSVGCRVHRRFHLSQSPSLPPRCKLAPYFP